MPPSAPSQNSQPPENQQQPTITKQKPPLAAQILYALGIGGLIIGLLATVYIFEGTSTVKFGVFGSAFKSLAVVYALIIIAGFLLINAIHNGKKWALIVYTAVFVLTFMNSLRTSITSITLTGNLVVAVLIFILWTQDRSYFK